MKEFMVGMNLDEKELESLMMFVIRWFNYHNSMFRVEKLWNGVFTLYWNMTQEQYNELCIDYSKTL